VEDVLVIDNFDVFNNSLSQWQNYLSLQGKTGITEISYLDYLQGTTGLPQGLGIEQFVFFDEVHPTSEFNQFLAEEISPRILSEYPNFAQSV
jgi:hypothetical protein